MSNYIEVSEATFERDVLERSKETPVVVDFWAEWCGPCRALGPVLEKLASEADGSWVLAKVDVDANQRLASAFGIQGIPAVKAFVDGRPAAEFTGALPEEQVRTWLEQLGPSPADLAFERGANLEAAGDPAGAAEAYSEALEHDPGHIAAKGRSAALELARRGAEVDVTELSSRHAAAPHNVGVAVALADGHAASGNFELAFSVLLVAVRATSGDERDRARLHLLSLLDALPVDDPRSMAARRDLGLALF